jgi:FKBP-type peptidyl-prolyl cis-trans isomerase
MKHGTALTAALVLASAACSGAGMGGGSLETFSDSASYAVGQGLGFTIQDRMVPVDVDMVVLGLREAISGNAQLAREDIGMLMQRLSQAGMEQHNDDMSVQNREEGEAYLAENAAREGVQVTESGLQYEVLEEGSGPRPAATDRVQVHYVGTRIDGTVFDSSRERGTPATFSLNGVIAGWTEGVQLMPVGSIYRFVIPADLAYGAAGSGPTIGPNATLVFEVELLGIE